MPLAESGHRSDSGQHQTWNSDKHDQSRWALSLGQWGEGYEPSDKTDVTCFPGRTFPKRQVAQSRKWGLKKPHLALMQTTLEISLTATDGRTEAKGGSDAIPFKLLVRAPRRRLNNSSVFLFQSLFHLFSFISFPTYSLPTRPTTPPLFLSSLYPSNKATIVAGFWFILHLILRTPWSASGSSLQTSYSPSANS